MDKKQKKCSNFVFLLQFIKIDFAGRNGQTLKHLYAVADVHLGIDALEVLFHRVDADAQLLRDVVVGPPLYGQIQHFALPGSQSILAAQFFLIALRKEITGISLFRLVSQTVCKVHTQLLQDKEVPGGKGGPAFSAVKPQKSHGLLPECDT